VVPVIVVGLIVDTVRADPPRDTVEKLWNPVPPIVTEVPPALAPLFGVIDVTVGGGGAAYVKHTTHEPL
jgi:hypothetical protein